MEEVQSVFIDSNVVVTAVHSSLGPGYAVITVKGVKKFTSNICLEEISETCTRLKLPPKTLSSVLKHTSRVVIPLSDEHILKKYSPYVLDIGDAHVVAGTIQAKSKFLVTHNIRHFLTDKIKSELGVQIITPGKLLHYLRSL